METVFIVNRSSGNGRQAENLIEKIKAKGVKLYITEGVGDATEFVRNYCETSGAARFIACGGDGTLSEVLNGVVDFSDAEIGVIPIGTGNDFARNFGGDFFDISAQITGDTQRCDIIKCTAQNGGKQAVSYGMNMFNIGFDCNVADLTNSLKKRRFIKGKIAYILAIFIVLIKKKGAKLKIEIDGNEFYSGSLLLTSIANGCYCGGGIKSNPLAEITDGYINLNIIYNISRINFLTKLPFYMRGTHIRLKNIQNIIYNTKCKKIAVTPLEGKMRLCCDGEISDSGRAQFEIMHEAVNFVIPKNRIAVTEGQK